MVKNMGSADRVIRMIVAIVLGVLILAGTLEGALAIILGVVAAILLITAFVGTCPLYLAFNFSTNR